MNDFYNRTAKDALAHFNVRAETGLTDKEVVKRQAQYGKNTLHIAETPLWRKLLEPFIDVFMLILVVAMVLSLLQRNWLEAFVIFVIIILDAVIYYIQKFSTDRILKSLKRSTLHTITVFRDGAEQSVEATELVPGDIVVLHEGDRIPADGRIINESGLLTNESMLTGESEAIAKDAKAISGTKKVYEQRNMVFSGSFVITGSGKFVVTATGDDTEYGRIASLASSLGEESPISKKMDKLVAQIAVVVIILAIIILVLQLLDGVSILQALEFTLAMAVSAVPEGLPIAISIILALCAARMAKRQALIKELRAIESIGIVTTIASDKTGTLTQNRLELREVWSPNLSPAELRKSIGAAALRECKMVESNCDAMTIDPLDISIAEYMRQHNSKLPTPDPVRSYAFDQGIKMSGNLYRLDHGKFLLQVKGAPETILARSRLDAKQLAASEDKLSEFAGRGYKVIAVASCVIHREINELTRLSKDDTFTFEGFIAVADALRPGVAAAIKQAARMGVKTKMVTGDHAGTAFAIGREIGLADDLSQVLDCSKLNNINDDDLADLVRDTTIFARVTPEDKYRILSAIKTNEICAMTGDGVNDVPALVGAHVGIAMGDSPSIVQDAGDIVLLDNNFKNITGAIQESRTVLANIRRMLVYLLATNAGEVLAMLGALVFAGSQMLTPLQILWINIVTDSLMVIPIGLEPPEKKVLRQKPEPKNAPILSSKLVKRMIVVACTMGVVTMLTFFISNSILHNREQANTLAFTSLVVMQWANAFSVRGLYESAWQRLKTPHKSFALAMAAAIILQIIALFGPMSIVLGTVPVPFLALALTTVLSFAIPLAIFELHKRIAQ